VFSAAKHGRYPSPGPTCHPCPSDTHPTARAATKYNLVTCNELSLQSTKQAHCCLTSSTACAVDVWKSILTITFPTSEATPSSRPCCWIELCTWSHRFYAPKDPCASVLLISAFFKKKEQLPTKNQQKILNDLDFSCPAPNSRTCICSLSVLFSYLPWLCFLPCSSVLDDGLDYLAPLWFGLSVCLPMLASMINPCLLL
jgi:hypothetical protein